MPDPETPEAPDGETPPETPDPPETPEVDDTPDMGGGAKKALTEERKARRDADKRAKAAEQELQKLREESMDAQQKAIAAARDEGKAEARSSYGARLVDAEVKAAAAGRSVDVDALLDGLDRTRFLDDGEPDVEAIASWVDRIAPVTPGAPPVPKVPTGARGETKPNQLTRADLKSMSPKDIEEARRAGRLDTVLKGAN